MEGVAGGPSVPTGRGVSGPPQSAAPRSEGRSRSTGPGRPSSARKVASRSIPGAESGLRVPLYLITEPNSSSWAHCCTSPPRVTVEGEDSHRQMTGARSK